MGSAHCVVTKLSNTNKPRAPIVQPKFAVRLVCVPNQNIRPTITVDVCHRKGRYITRTIDTEVVRSFRETSVFIQINSYTFFLTQSDSNIKIAITIDIRRSDRTDY